MSLIFLADRQPLARSRQQLVAWSARCASRQRYHDQPGSGLGTGAAAPVAGLVTGTPGNVAGFVTGPCPRTVATLSRGLRDTIYNAGARDTAPLAELLSWLPWQRLVVIEQGHCWELPLGLARPVLPAAAQARPAGGPLTPPQREAQAYARLGRGYAD